MREKIQRISPLVDQFSRTISYLRLSVTDHCNLRCIYCMPETKDEEKVVASGKFLRHSDLLTYEELLRVVRLAVALGMSKLRLTGGEPLMRREILGFIESLTRLEGLEQIRLTTNGVLLGDYAARLYELGVRHINVSLDTLQRAKFQKITGRDYFERVWTSLLEAQQLGFTIKINAVAMAGINDDEFLDFARMALKYPFQMRFIEFMPAGSAGSWQRTRFVAVDTIQKQIAALGRLKRLEKGVSSGPARMFELVTPDGQRGEIGFISPISHHFCEECNRLRMTAEGHLRACLLRDYETDLRFLLRSGASDEQLSDAIRKTILNKPKGHELQGAEDAESLNRCGGGMSRIGG